MMYGMIGFCCGIVYCLLMAALISLNKQWAILAIIPASFVLTFALLLRYEKPLCVGSTTVVTKLNHD